MPKRVPIKAAKEFAKSQGLDQVIIAAWDGERTHIVTYGKSTEDCDQAAQGGDLIKKALGWPEEANSLPSRVKKLTAEVARLKEELDFYRKTENTRTVPFLREL